MRHVYGIQVSCHSWGHADCHHNWALGVQEVLAQLEQVVLEHQDVLERQPQREGVP